MTRTSGLVLCWLLLLGIVPSLPSCGRSDKNGDSSEPGPANLGETLIKLERAVPTGLAGQSWPRDASAYDRRVRDVRSALVLLLEQGDGALGSEAALRTLNRAGADLGRSLSSRANAGLRHDLGNELTALVRRVADLLRGTGVDPRLVLLHGWLAEDDAAVETLRQALSNDEFVSKEDALIVLRHKGRAAWALVPLLLRLVGDDSLGTEAGRTLAALAPPASIELRLALRNSDANVRIAVLEAVAHPGGAPMWREVVAALDHEAESTRYFACRALEGMAVQTQAVVDALAARLSESGTRVPAQAAYALRAIGPVERLPLKAIRAALRKATGTDLTALLRLVASYGERAEPLDDAIEEALNQRTLALALEAHRTRNQISRNAHSHYLQVATSRIASTDDREAAIHALGYPGDDRGVTVLIDVVASDGDPILRADAARALGTIGPRARAALPVLRDLSSDPSLTDEVEDAVGRAVRKIERCPPK